MTDDILANDPVRLRDQIRVLERKLERRRQYIRQLARELVALREQVRLTTPSEEMILRAVETTGPRPMRRAAGGDAM